MVQDGLVIGFRVDSSVFRCKKLQTFVCPLIRCFEATPSCMYIFGDGQMLGRSAPELAYAYGLRRREAGNTFPPHPTACKRV